MNVGGALIPGLMSLYLFVKHRLWIRGLLAIACVAALCHLLAQPLPGLGIALPVFVSAIGSALVALLLSLRRAAPLAYIGGSLGTLVGADLLNLGSVNPASSRDRLPRILLIRLSARTTFFHSVRANVAQFVLETFDRVFGHFLVDCPSRRTLF